MKKDDFMDAWNDVDKDFLAEADDMQRRGAQHDNGKKRLAVLLATAAVLTVGIALTAVVLIRGNSKETVIPAAELKEDVGTALTENSADPTEETAADLTEDSATASTERTENVSLSEVF